ncbi:hypothetical protein Patl1_27022 [Pistacia atlantica]|uniref:Uncharacterized protein n=1 Tax=Pistacia atlantica TaxID=434234 RepID=A0ACC1B1Y6_9ROSI|nr:hypothetical protein Patl1_27022 [Pistacia atlantica]
MAAKLIVSIVFFFFILFFVTSNAALNVIAYGAKPDGKTDSTEAFLRAWTVACGSAKGATIYVPKGRVLASGIAGSMGKIAQVGARPQHGWHPCASPLPALQSPGSTLQTGDDCISIGPGTRNLFMKSIKCGPGHGVSIGSLGRELNEDGVENVTLTNAVFTGSDNGTSGVKISQVTYRNIQGTSATPEAMTFDCSSSNPCTEIRLHDIKLKYMKETATSSCNNIHGTTSGVTDPESCF